MPDLMTIPETAAYLRLGRSETYAMAARGDLPVVRFGRRVVVPRDALEEWLRARTEGAA